MRHACRPQSMRMLFYSLNYAPELTATGKYTGDMAAWFARRGHEVDAIAGMPHYPQWALLPDYAPARYLQEDQAGVRVMRVPHFIPERPNVSAASRIRMELSFIFKSLRYWSAVLVSARRYDCVVLVCPPLFTSFYAVVYRLVRGVPWVIHVQDIQTDVAVSLGLVKNRFLKRLLYFLERFVLRRASMISTISESMKIRLETKAGAGRDVLLTPNWSDPDVLNSASHQNTFRRENGIPEDKRIVMYSGNLGEKQGVEIIVEVAALLQNHTQICMVVVGDGVARDDMVAMADDIGLSNIMFLPVQRRVDLPSMLQAADLHLVIQKQATFASVLPSKLANIFAAGRPCIVTAGKGTDLEAMVSSNSLGLAVEPDNAAELTEAIIRLVDDNKNLAEMGKNARKYAIKQLDMDQILRRLEQRLESHLRDN